MSVSPAKTLMISLMSILMGAALLFAAPQLLASDDFSDGDYTANPTWVLTHGNASVINQQLHFADNLDTGLYLDFNPMAGNPISVSFNLLQTNSTGASYVFRFSLVDTGSGQAYVEKASPNVNFYGGAPNNSGFHSYNSGGALIVGEAGVHLNTDASWQTITIDFSPETGIVIKKDGVVAAQWTNYLNLTQVNRLYLENVASNGIALHWIVDDVIIQGQSIPGPQYCGDTGTVFHQADLTGPNGQPDCYVNTDDLAALADNWLACTDPENPNCDQQAHTTTEREDLAIQTVYRNGVPHTDKNGNVRFTYSPTQSFFPIGTWGTPLHSATYNWNHLVAADYNTVWPWNRPLADSLDDGADYNMQIIHMGEIDTATFTQYKDHANLLGNVWKDEPPLTGSESTQAYNDFVAYRDSIHAIDPDFPVFVNNVPWITDPALPQWIAFTQASDIAGHDNYPIKPLTNTIGYNPNGIPQVMLLSANTVNQQKPVWVILGAFTQPGNPDEPFPFRMPTATQLRGQVYASLIHGATGIHYFIWDSYISRDGNVIGMTPDPQVQHSTMALKASPEQLNRAVELWNTSAQINTELETLIPSLLSPTAGPEIGYALSILGPDISHAPIRCLLKIDPAGGYQLLTVNLDEAPFTVTYTFDDALSQVAPLFENRSALSLDDAHSFTETYDPYAAHVYHITLTN